MGFSGKHFLVLWRVMKKLLLSLALFVFCSQNAWAAIAYVSSSVGGSASNVSTITTTGLSTSTGNAIVVATSIGGSSITVTSVTDTAGNTYSHNASCSFLYAGIPINLDIWYSLNITGNAANIVTVNFSAPHTFAEIAQLQYSGMGAFQLCTTAAGTGTSLTSSSFSPSIANGVNIENARDGTGGLVYTAGTNYTLRASSVYQADRYPAPSGSQTASLSVNTSTNIAIVVASFAPASNTISTIYTGSTGIIRGSTIN